VGGTTYLAASKRAAAKAPATTNPNIDARALDLMKKVGETYASLSSLSVDIQVHLPKPADDTLNGYLKYQKPDLLTVHREMKGKELTAVADGKSVYIYSPLLKGKYITAPSQTSVYGVLRQLETYIGDTGFQSMFNLLGGQDLLPSKTSLRSLKLQAAAEGGTPVNRVIATVGRFGRDEATVTYDLGRTDHLLRRLEVRAVFAADSFLENYTNVKANGPLPKNTFAFAPPAGAKAVSPPIYYDTRLKPGAAPMPIRSVDLDGKPISLDQYKGKITMVYFWGTWCPPCVAEMPEIVDVYRKYKNKGFEVMGVPLEDRFNKAKVALFLNRRGLPWRQAFEGKRDGNTIAEQYKVSATPFSLLIGRDGKIVAVDLRGEKEITAAVEQALAKSS
jgi:thiol-disulfide isomerase/thioredoxin/outer membrane lipoprotein-sorting protein